MKKAILLLSLTIYFSSCSDKDINTDVQPDPIASSTTDLVYPSNRGTSGGSDILLGYGYDATGFCDTVSVKEKIFNRLPYNIYSWLNSTLPTYVSGGSFDELTEKIKNNATILGSGEILYQHVKSLLKLANATISTDSSYAYTYYAITYLNFTDSFKPDSNNQSNLTDSFKEDMHALSPEEIISKYGTHVITSIFDGTKFEVIYRCKLPKLHAESLCEDLFYLRMKEFFGGTPGFYRNIDAETMNVQTDEELIYNSIGSKNKLCGLIRTTGYNPDYIKYDLVSLFNKKNCTSQFIAIGRNGAFPIYELIEDETKKQDVKEYTEHYMNHPN